METMGRHVIAELWQCDFDKLNDMDYIEKTFVDAALKSGAEIREVAFHKFGRFNPILPQFLISIAN